MLSSRAIFVIVFILGLGLNSSQEAQDPETDPEQDNPLQVESPDETVEKVTESVDALKNDELNPGDDDADEAIDKDSGEGEGEAQVDETAVVENDNSTANATAEPKQSPKKVSCASLRGLNLTTETTLEENAVEILNGTGLLLKILTQYDTNVTNRSTPAVCSVVMFYAPWCPFSAKAAPSFNGLARLFPDLYFIATDTNRNQGLTAQFGVLALPTLILFHNSKPIVKFNQTVYELEHFVSFVNMYTGIEATGEAVISEADKAGPLPTEVVPETDIMLYLSWIFVIVCALGYFGKSPFCQRIVEAIRNNWQEAEIQHEHID